MNLRKCDEGLNLTQPPNYNVDLPDISYTLVNTNRATPLLSNRWQRNGMLVMIPTVTEVLRLNGSFPSDYFVPVSYRISGRYFTGWVVRNHLG